MSNQTEVTAPPDFSRRYRFGDWPNGDIPRVSAGVYAIWDEALLVYCGMSGRSYTERSHTQRKTFGLFTRLNSHASGRLSGDQFCVYIANRLVIPSLRPDDLAKFSDGTESLDRLTKTYIRSRLEYQFATVATSAQAYQFERECRIGHVFGMKPFLNPL